MGLKARLEAGGLRGLGARGLEVAWARLLIALVMLALAGPACVQTPAGGPPDPLSPAERAELLRIGEAAMAAIQGGDLERLWLHARSDLRENAASRQAMGPELEAYLFGDVRRVMATARQLTVRVVPLGADERGTRWAQLIFFDSSTVTEGMLGDRNFLCEHDLRDAVAWTFMRARGRWEAIGYPFDAFTDIHCPPAPSQIGIRRRPPGHPPVSEMGLWAGPRGGSP
jgi:hypothetical protein